MYAAYLILVWAIAVLLTRIFSVVYEKKRIDKLTSGMKYVGLWYVGLWVSLTHDINFYISYKQAFWSPAEISLVFILLEVSIN